MNKLILGTAQFGNNYGIKQDGQPSISEVEKIARVAWDGGIRVIHHSWQYNISNIDVFDNFQMMCKDRDNPRYFWWKNEKGISLYHPSELNGYFFDMIQFPCNILDSRFLNLRKGSINIARSVFLQGLLLMDELPSWISKDVRLQIIAFKAICAQKNLQPYEAALGWVLGLDEVDYIIVGVNNAKQLEQLLQVKPLKWDYDFSIADENVLDPRRWPV